MKKLFKSIDEKFAAIGFLKMQDDKYGVRYERMDEFHDYIHVLYIGHKADGNHIIQSYDRENFGDGYIGNVGVGLTYYETKLALKKMKKKRMD